jgi:hypothetical protein
MEIKTDEDFIWRGIAIPDFWAVYVAERTGDVNEHYLFKTEQEAENCIGYLLTLPRYKSLDNWIFTLIPSQLGLTYHRTI